MKGSAKKVLLVGWDAAEWKIINPLLEKGLMPALAGLIERGVMGNIATLDPPLSPMLWTSIATGKTADKHGILGFIEPVPDQHSLRPVAVTSRKVKAIWNILTQENLKAHTVGWWPSHPAEPINGICISNMYAKPKGSIDKVWPMMPGTVHPPELENLFAGLRIHPEEITAAHILPFIPLADKVDQDTDKGLQMLAKSIAESASIHSAATWILENEEWNFLGVYFNALDHLSHIFMKFHPPRMEGLPEDVFEIYKDVMESTYRFYDMMLERKIKLAGPDATVILVSDHGFHSDHLRWRKLPDDPVSPALEHSPYGVLCLAGPGIKKDERVYGATLLDITPTILALFGLPVANDMDGKVLNTILENDEFPPPIESWESVAGNCGMHPSEMQADPWSSNEAMQQLVELGYVEAPDADLEVSIRRTTREAKFYLAKVFLSKHQDAEALPLLEKLVSEDPSALRYSISLALCYQSLGKLIQFRDTIENIKTNLSAPPAYVHFLEGILAASENKPFRALEHFRKVEATQPNHIGMLVHVGNIYLKLRKWEEAGKVFAKVISLSAENANAHHGLSVAHLRMGKVWDAIDEALTAVGLMHFFPAAHYHLGEALFAAGEFETSRRALEVCLVQNPAHRKAHQWLHKIYSDKLPDHVKLAHHSAFLEKNTGGTIKVFTGLPYSGVTDVMNLLHDAGAQILTDHSKDKKPPGSDLDFGYSKTELLATNNDWLSEVGDRLLRIEIPQLFYLPDTFRYRVVMLLRDIDEVSIALQKPESNGGSNFNLALINTLASQLQQSKIWMESQPNVDVLYLDYNEVIASPNESRKSIEAFMDVIVKLQ